jgi:hypothetical protein
MRMSTFRLHGPVEKLATWIESALRASKVSTIDFSKFTFHFSTLSGPPADLQSLADDLQALRKHASVEFNFVIDDDEEGQLRYTAAPLMSLLDTLVAEKVVGLEVTPIC